MDTLQGAHDTEDHDREAPGTGAPGTQAPAGDGEAPQGGWVLQRAEAAEGSWVRRSASAHTLLLGGAFASLLLLSVGHAMDASLGAQAAAQGRAWLMAIAIASFLPLVGLAWLHERQRVRAIDVDPNGLTLHTARGVREVRFDDLAEVRAVAEPVFGGRRVRAHGALEELPSFAPSLHLKVRDGSRWEFAGRSVEDIEGLLAWLDVLGAKDRIVAPPSALAAKNRAERSIKWAAELLIAAIAVGASGLFLQVAERLWPGVLPGGVGIALLAMAGSCVLYMGSYRAQVLAARSWLESRGLGGAPLVAAAAPLAAVPPAR